MKKIIVYALCLVSTVFASIEKKPEDKIIQLSKIEWNAVKECVDTNGYCRIVGQNAIIVITNGLPNIDMIHWLPIGRGPEKKKKYERRYEPVPYVGQGGW